MLDAQIDAMILELLEEADRDLAKSYRAETAEEPEFVEEDLGALRNVVRRHMR